ncbi:MAG TPA: hypothetical protein VNU70_08195 [Puia sp.]|jgi:hypothetical protein|nr:hypothetical protein [Puia sp.]
MHMNTEAPMEDRLWDYIDGIANPAERSAIDDLLATNREWQEKYSELLNVHRLLDASELEAPSLRFTRNVMEEIARYHVAPATRTYINKNIIRGIGAFFLTLILGFTAYILAQFKWTSHSSNDLLPAHSDLGLARLSNVDLSKAFSATYVTLFMLVAVVMSFMLLDLYLQRKKQSRSF